MKPIKFPTIHQMMYAIEVFCGGYCGSCRYDEQNHQFIVVELLPVPHRDSGGSIDCIDFIESESTISFKSAYEMWADFNGLIERKPVSTQDSMPTVYVDSIVDFPDDLPF